MASQSLKLRRGALALAASLIALFTVLQIPGPRVDAQVNPIAAENALTGNPSSEWDVSGAGDSSIQGFATNMSVTPGQTVQFKISTTASNYAINIYRMGYYGGQGARRVATIAPSAVQNQPGCLTAPTTGLVDCGNWAVSASWAVPASAVSGIYFAKLTRSDTGGSSHIFFVVREADNAVQKSDILFQTSDTTWQAYNQYGGNSLYVGSPGTNPSRAYKVSYNRPITTRGTAPEDFVFNAEYPMVRWLEANGYNVSYTTGVDSDRNGARILGHKMFMAVGHDEYWSGNQRTAVEAARDAGVHIAFFTGNGTFWKTRWENSIDASNTPYRTLVCYKETHAGGSIDPAAPIWTGTWRDPRFSPPGDGGRPENALMGTIFKVNDGTNGTASITVPSAQGKHRFWRNTTVATLAANATATLPNGVLGYEWDEAPNDVFAPRGLMRLSTTTLNVGSKLLDYGSTYGSGTATHNLTLYRDDSGALVFGAGTMQWSWGLDSRHDRGSAAADLRMQQATVNLLADMGAQPSTLQANLVQQSASADVTKPLSTIASPASGSSFASGSQVTISGTASDSGGIVAGVEVSVDGGATWAPATGTTNWTYQWTVSGSGSATIRSRAYDDTGNMEVPASGNLITITAGRTCPCSIWNATSIPSPVDDNDPAAVTLGTKFRADMDGFVTAIRFYKNNLNTGTHVGGLWTTSGVLLSSVTFTNETASGWQQMNLPSAVPITANTTYVVTYFAPNGHYSAPDSLFESAVDNPPLHGLRDGVDGANGVYVYGTSHAFPTNTYQAEGYFVDVVFNTVAPPDTTPPTITGRFPVNGATNVDPATPITVTFNEAMLASSISSSTSGKEGTATTGTLELRDSLNVLVTATVTYDNTTKTATLRPTIPLSLLTGYTVTVLGGAADPRVKDLAGNALAATSSWSFTTAAAPPPPPTCPCSIWAPTVVPQKIDDGDPNTVELGTRFRSDVAGYVTGARFYKGALNTGTHIAKLWTNAGVLLGSATFANETTSGWQETAFTTPIAIAANTTYVITYHANNGHYSSSAGYFASAGVDNGPLHALRDGVDGPNGVYGYGASAFPTSTFQSEGYFVDVVFNTTNGPDTTPPVVNSVTPPAGMSGVKTNASITATFNEAMSAASITSSSVLLRDPLGASVPATVTYNAGTRVATLVPSSALANSTIYRIVIKGGSTDPRVKDAAGNALASDYTSTFTTAAPPPPPPTQGPGGPVLVVTAASNPFTTYYAEILRTEGMNAFATADISTVNAGTLANYDLVILGEMPLTSGQVSMFTTWVNGGGNLIAMKPDKQLAGLLGLVDAGATLAHGYIKVNTASGPGNGIVGETMQFHGTADLYTPSGGTTVIATLYSNATAATASPAVTSRAVGAGRAVAFTYPLGQSIVLTRQGNPAWSGQERDGLTPIRSDDLFFGNRASDPQPDWVNLAKVAIPQADEQQRLLWNIMLDVNASKKPLPRFWYFPRMLKAVVIMTGDDHANGGTVGRFDSYLSNSNPGCSVEDWTCIRGTSYIFPGTPLTNTQAASYVAQGFEIGLHVNTNCADWTTTTLPQFYSTQLSQFATLWPSVPPPTTNRTHCIVWSDFATQPQVELNNGIRFDTNYYYWPDVWVLDKPGMYTGSGMPMRFATAGGQMIDVYQATSQLTDESGQTWPKNVDTLLDNALGPLGYYGAFTANMHTDFNPSAGQIGSDAIVASAKARSVPVITARQMLDWLDGRNASRFDNITYSSGVLSFTVEVGAGANGLRMLLPAFVGSNQITGIALNGTTVGYTLETIKGVQYAIVPSSAGAYQVSYGADITAPVISGRTATPTFNTAQIAWTTNEPATSRVEFGTDPASLISNVTSSALVAAHALTLTGLSPNTTYYYRVISVDETGNSVTSPATDTAPASFTTLSPAIAGSVGVSGAGATVTLSGAASATRTADSGGNFRFDGLGNGAYTVTPSKAGFVFTPASRAVTVNGADVNGVNFTAQEVVITGTITPAANAEGATVALTGAVSRLVAVDASGAFTFGAMPNGTYTITPSRTNYTFTPASQSVTVNGASVTGVTFTAEPVPTWSISGAISPAAGGSGTTLSITGGTTVVADASGNYSAPGLLDGTYTVTPSKAGYTFSPASATITIAGGNVSGVNFIANAVTIAGTVTAGADAAGTTLTLSGPVGGTVGVDGAGGYLFAGLPNGTYTVTPSKAGYAYTPANRVVTISGGASVSGVDFVARVIPIRKISGTISPAANGSGTVLSLGEGSTAVANASGAYQFTNIADGTYAVSPSKPGFTFTPVSQVVTVAGVDLTGINFTAAAVTVSGSIGPLPEGAGVTVALSGGGSVTTDSAGAFSFSGVVNGTYTVTPSKGGYSFTPATRTITVANGVSVGAVDFTAALLPATISIDAIKTAGRTPRSTTIASGTFSTAEGNELLLAFVAAANITSAPTTVTQVTGGGLTWTLVRRTNVQRGTSEVWRAWAAAKLTNVSVTATLSQSVGAQITIMSFKGIDSTGTNGSGAIGASASASAPTGAPSASLVTTRANSLVIGVGNDWDGNVARVLGPNQTLVSQFLSTDGDTFWVQRTSSVVPQSGTTVTINDTAPTNHQYNLTIVEIKGGS